MTPTRARGVLGCVALAPLALAGCEGVTLPALDAPGACAAPAGLPAEQALQADELARSVGIKVGGSLHAAFIPDRLGELGARGMLLSWNVAPERHRALARALGLDGLVILEDVEQARAALAFYAGLATSIAYRENAPVGPGWGAMVRAKQERLYRLVKDDPATRHLAVVGPNIGSDDQIAEVGDLSAVVDAGTIFPWRTAERPEPPETRVAHDLARNARVFPGRPMVAEQVGVRLGGAVPVSETVQAKYVLRLYLWHLRLGVPRTYFAELADASADLPDLGIVRADGTPRPAFTALARLLRLTADPGPAFGPGRLAFSLQGASGELRHVLLQKRDGTFLLALWRERLSEDQDAVETVTLNLGTPARALYVHRPLVSGEPAPQGGGRTLVLPVSDAVTLVGIDPDCGGR